MQQKRTEQEETFLKAIGEIIREQRKIKNISLNIFAFENDIQKSLLSRIENGKNEIKILSLRKIAKSLDLKLSTLLEMIEKKEAIL